MQLFLEKNETRHKDTEKSKVPISLRSSAQLRNWCFWWRPVANTYESRQRSAADSCTGAALWWIVILKHCWGTYVQWWQILLEKVIHVHPWKQPEIF